MAAVRPFASRATGSASSFANGEGVLCQQHKEGHRQRRPGVVLPEQDVAQEQDALHHRRPHHGRGRAGEQGEEHQQRQRQDALPPPAAGQEQYELHKEHQVHPGHGGDVAQAGAGEVAAEPVGKAGLVAGGQCPQDASRFAVVQVVELFHQPVGCTGEPPTWTVPVGVAHLSQLHLLAQCEDALGGVGVGGVLPADAGVGEVAGAGELVAWF